MKSKKEKKVSRETEARLTFLKKVKDGMYTKVDAKTLKQARRNEQPKFFGDDEDYYYGIS